MVDESGHRRVAGQQAPDFLTVLQMAEVLQVGRSTAYELVGRYVATNGAEGIPAILVGGQYRVPRTRLEEATGQPISWPPAPRQRRSPSRRATVEAPAVRPVVVEVEDEQERSDPSAPPAADRVGEDLGTARKPSQRDVNAIRRVSDVPTDDDVDPADASDEPQPPLPFAG